MHRLRKCIGWPSVSCVPGLPLRFPARARSGSLTTPPRREAAHQRRPLPPLSEADVSPTAASASAPTPQPLTASSLFLLSGVAADLEMAGRLGGGPVSFPDPTSDGRRGDSGGGTSLTTHYAARLRSYFVNPFNGKQTPVDSPIARQLARLGFHRGEVNPLHLAWSPDTYYQSFHRTRERLMKARARRELSAKRHGRTAGREGEGSVSVGEVLTDLLRPFESTRSARRPEWRADVARLMRRRDALTAVPAELQALYAALTSSYMPPKLDATPDPGIADVELTVDQANVAQLAMRGYSIFIGGSAGTGKTVLIKAIYRQLTRMGLRVAMTATTGVAAVQLGGCTFHRALSVPVGETAVFGKPKGWDQVALRAVDVLIIDEVSLLSAHVLDALDMEARLARMQYTPFGGMQVIVCGDFLQLANQSTEDAVPAYESVAFHYLRQLKLVTPMRHVAGDPLNRFLQELRRGRCDEAVLAKLDRPIPADAQHVTYIFPRRRDAQLLNDEKLSELRTPEMVCTPQRGPLELIGTFTHAALITFAPQAAPLPSREAIVAVVRAEVVAVLTELHSTVEPVVAGSSPCTGDEAPPPPPPPIPVPPVYTSSVAAAAPGFGALAEHDVVVMPTRTTAPGLILRLRVAEGVAGSLARREARISRTASVAAATTAMASPSPSPTSTTDATTDATAAAAVATPRPPPFRSPAAFMRAHPEVWTRTAERVAARIGGALVQLFELEPSTLVPLSVSSVLASPSGDADAVESLQPLRLRLGCRVMITRNLSRTVSNGSVGVVEAFAPPDVRLFPRQAEVPVRVLHRRTGGREAFAELPVVRLLNGEVVQVPPVPVMLGGTPLTYYYGHEVYTLPLQLGYGFTVHKVQGLTLHGTVVLDCKGFFECPHLIYVACSRVRSLDQLVVWNMRPDMVMVRKSALDFSDALQEANSAHVLAVPPEVPRAAWTTRISPHVHPL